MICTMLLKQTLFYEGKISLTSPLTTMMMVMAHGAGGEGHGSGSHQGTGGSEGPSAP